MAGESPSLPGTGGSPGSSAPGGSTPGGNAPGSSTAGGRPAQPGTDLPAAPLALYRRYRPGSFADVKGQDHVTEPLRQALRSGRVHHAYLFSGPRGCGKTSSARILARSLNCELGPTPDPCGKCPSCIALAPAGPGSIDVIEIDAASHGGVDDARDLRERAFYAPVSGRFKIYIIDEAHMVTREGFNALLKLVEEPPPHLKFVFATTEPEKVIATIRSRTHHYPFRLVPPAILREHLEGILASEDVPYEPAVLPVVIRAGGGSVRDAMSVLDQLIAGSDAGGLRYDRAIELLGYTDDRLLDEVVEAFSAGDGAAVFHAVDHVVEAGHDPRRFAADLLDRLRDLIVLSAVPDAGSTGLIEAPADRLEQLTGQAAGLGQAGLTRAAEVISAGLVEMRGATSPRLLLELMCAQVLLPPAGDNSVLAERVERLERQLSAARQEAPSRSAPAKPALSRSVRAVEPPADPAPAAKPERSANPETSTKPEPSADPAPTAKPKTSTKPEASADPAPTAKPETSPEPARAAGPPHRAQPVRQSAAAAPVDTDSLRSRWPEVLDAIQRRKRVAWMQLSHASVESLADGVLTLAFAQAGIAKGFEAGGYDRDLAQVLSDLLGVSPQIRTSVTTGGSSGQDLQPETGPPAAPPSPGTQRRGEPPANDRAGQPRAGGAPRAGRQSSAAAARQAAPQSGWDAQAGAGHGPDPSDAAAPDMLTGTDLVARELGGRVIQELDGP